MCRPNPFFFCVVVDLCVPYDVNVLCRRCCWRIDIGREVRWPTTTTTTSKESIEFWKVIRVADSMPADGKCARDEAPFILYGESGFWAGNTKQKKTV